MTTHADSRTQSGLPALGLFLALGLIVSALLIGRSFEKVKSAGQTITVKGYAERRIESDVASWSGNVSARAPRLTDAYTQLSRDVDKVFAWFAAQGVPRDKLTVSPVNTETQYGMTADGRRTNTVEGYALNQQLSLESDDVALVSRLAGESSALIREGVEFRSWEPSYFYSKIEDMKIELLGEATRNARDRAAQLAENSGSRVGALRSARQGVFQITPVNSTMVSDYGTYDTRTIEKAIKAVVTVEYAID